MHILITGSSGQIGTNLAMRLLNHGHTMLGLDIRPNEWSNDLPTIECDLKDTAHPLESLISSTNGRAIDLVVHLAAHAKVYELVEQPHRALENIEMTFNVLDFCRKNRLPIIFSSSREVYGDVHHHLTEESCADFVVAESPYSASKISGEALIYSYAKCYSLPYLVFRFSNVYGRFDNDLERMERVIPLFIDRIRNRLPITIFGKEKTLDFTYVDDCVSGIYSGIQKLLSLEVYNQTINLAFGKGNTLDQVVDYISQVLDINPDVHYEPSRPGEVTRYVADISKAIDWLGYQPTTPISEGIFKAIAWAETFQQQRTGA